MKKLVIDKGKLGPLVRSKNVFASLVRSIIFQQLSGKAATAILNRFIALLCENESTRPLRSRHKFPKPEDVLRTTDAKLRSTGLSYAKISYLKDLASKFMDGSINPKLFPKMSDKEITEHLVQVRGIGPWTAHMFLIFALNRPNVLPIGDLAIRKGFQKAFNLKAIPDEKKMRALAKVYDGEHTYLSLYLWAVMDDTISGVVE